MDTTNITNFSFFDFTPIRNEEGHQKNFKQYIQEGIEDYFYLGGKCAYIIPGKIDGGSQELEIKTNNQNQSKIKQVVLTAIKIISYMTVAIPLTMLVAPVVIPIGITIASVAIPFTMLVAKAIFRGTHKFHTVSSAELLGKGLSISEKNVQDVQDVIGGVLAHKEINGVKFCSKGFKYTTFSVDSVPNVIFKMSRRDNENELVEELFDRMVQSKTICRMHELDLLVIPKAKMIKVEHNGELYTLIAQEKIDTNAEKGAQERNYREHATSLNETIRQLTCFICKTGFSDIKWSKAPVIENSLNDGNRKICLADLIENSLNDGNRKFDLTDPSSLAKKDRESSAQAGLFGVRNKRRILFCGNEYQRGLVNCVNEEQGRIVVEEARKHIPVLESVATEAMDCRKEEIRNNEYLATYYQEHGVTNGAELLGQGLNLTIKKEPVQKVQSVMGSVFDYFATYYQESSVISRAEQDLTIEKEAMEKEIVQKVQSVMGDVLANRKRDDVKFYNGNPSNHIFSVDSIPNIIFKHGGDSDKRFKNMVRAKAVCVTHKLGLLVIPKAKMIEIEHKGRIYRLIAEERIDINAETSAQEENYSKYATSLNETIRELALFICKTDFSDMEWRNAPVVNNSLDANGNRKIALVDLEEMTSLQVGLFGGGRTGLVRCVNEEQGRIVVEEARKHTPVLQSEAEAVMESRKRKIEDDQNLAAYHQKNNITTGAEPIKLKEELDFSEFPDSEKLSQIAKELVSEINRLIQESSVEKSLKGRRYIEINGDSEPFFFARCNFVGNAPGGFKCKIQEAYFNERYKNTEANFNATYLGVIINKLLKLGHIYKYNPNGYGIQA